MIFIHMVEFLRTYELSLGMTYIQLASSDMAGNRKVK